MLRQIIILLLCLCASAVLIAASLSPAEVYEKSLRRVSRPSEIKEIVEQGFDLNRAEVSEFMLAKMNKVKMRGDTPSDVMRKLLEADPGKAMEWLLEVYPRLEPAGRANLIGSFGDLDAMEIFPLLTSMLDDRSFVVNEYAAKIWPGPEDYLHMRVCDDAYNRLILYLGYDSGRFPAAFPKVLGPYRPIEFRDQTISDFKVWWKGAMNSFVRQKQSLSASHPAIDRKLKAALQNSTKSN